MVVAVVVSHFKKRKIEPKVCGFTKGPFFCLFNDATLVPLKSCVPKSGYWLVNEHVSEIMYRFNILFKIRVFV